MTASAAGFPYRHETRIPLDWRALVLATVGHMAVVGWLIGAQPSVERMSPRPPIFAQVLELERANPEIQAPVQIPVPAEPVPVAPTPKAPPPAQPEPKPLLTAPEPVPAPAAFTAPPPPADPTLTPAEAAALAPAPATTPSRATIDSLPGDPDELRNYIAAVMRQLNRHKTYPRALKKAKVEGTVIVQFTIDRDGHLIASGVKLGSGYVELDRAAMDMLASANPLPAIPDFMHREELALAIPVEYSLITDR